MTSAAIIHLALGCVRKNPTARVSLMERRSLPDQGSSLDSGLFSGVSTSVRTGSFTATSSSYGEIFIRSATLFSSQECSRPLLCLAQGAYQRKLGYIVLIQGLNMVFIRTGNRFLRLHNFKASRNARLVAVLRFFQLFGGEPNLLVGHGHLIVRGLYVQQRRADFILHAGPQILELKAFLPQQSCCLIDVSLHLSTLKDRYMQAGGNRECVFSASRRRANKTCLPAHIDCWQRLAFCGLHRQLS